MAGLQIWDQNGVLIWDETTQTIKMLGVLSVGSAFGTAASGSITDARFTAYAQHVPFYARIDGLFSASGYDAVISFSGTTLRWAFPDSRFMPSQTIIYGIR